MLQILSHGTIVYNDISEDQSYTRNIFWRDDYNKSIQKNRLTFTDSWWSFMFFTRSFNACSFTESGLGCKISFSKINLFQSYTYFFHFDIIRVKTKKPYSLQDRYKEWYKNLHNLYSYNLSLKQYTLFMNHFAAYEV